MHHLRDPRARGRYQWLRAWARIGGMALRIGLKGIRCTFGK